MNELEHTLFFQGLENMYAAVLMGDGDALEQIERLITLARDLDRRDPAKQPMDQELAWVRNYCQTCWPKARLTIHCEGTDYACRIQSGQLSHPVCEAIAQSYRQGRLPDELSVWWADGRVCFRLSCDGEVCGQGTFTHE